ncbi:hypothetical protein MTO96_013255 [Rhipicephalus appendiculatus]
MGFVHVPCLEQWINQEKVDFCELCGQRFPMVAQPSNVLKFFHWVSQSNWLSRTFCQQKHSTMPNDQHKNQKEDTSAASVQSAREEDGCLVPSSLPCETESSILPVVNDQPAFENSVQKGGDDGATWSQDNRAPSPPAPALVSDSEYETADDNVSHDTPSGSSNEDGSGGPMCRICHEGDQEEPLVVALQLLWHHGLRACALPRTVD